MPIIRVPTLTNQIETILLKQGNIVQDIAAYIIYNS